MHQMLPLNSVQYHWILVNQTQTTFENYFSRPETTMEVISIVQIVANLHLERSHLLRTRQYRWEDQMGRNIARCATMQNQKWQVVLAEKAVTAALTLEECIVES